MTRSSGELSRRTAISGTLVLLGGGRTAMAAARAASPALPLTRKMIADAIAAGEIAGAVAMVESRGETATIVAGDLDASGAPMRADAIFALASMSKPIMAVIALGLVEEGALALDEPIDRLLPELADRMVLRQPDGALADTVPAERPINLRDLLTFRSGYGTGGVNGPFQQALRGIDTMDVRKTSPEAFLTGLAATPLQYQPGHRWLYDTSSDILGVLLERRTGKTLDRLCRERVFGSLGMKDTGFHLTAGQARRQARAATRAVAAYVQNLPAPTAPPPFRSGGHGLYGSAPDYLAFARMLMRGGRGVASARSVALMSTDSMTAEDGPALAGQFADGRRWGMGLAVQIREIAGGPRRGAIGWAGAMGTMFLVDPALERISLLMIQRYPRMPERLGGPPPALAAQMPPNSVIQNDFRTAVYRDLA